MILMLRKSVKAENDGNLATPDRLIRLLEELKSGYDGFTWESELWIEAGGRRSPYRALVLFGLSARTRDALLVEMCREFFRRLPGADDLARAGGSAANEVIDVVRPGQLPFVVSMASSISAGVPRDLDELMGIKGVGHKIGECVLAYGWGEDALPLDANCVRVLGRVFGLGRVNGRAPEPGPLREYLKYVYLIHTGRFAALSIGMVDIHEVLRLHGQVCCSRSPNCSRCPVSGCVSRREPWDGTAVVEVMPTLWDDWRELINEPLPV